MHTDRAPYGRHTTPVPAVTLHSAPSRMLLSSSDTYYDVPTIKQSHYGQLIAGYFFIGGIAGASQILATIADWLEQDSDRDLVRSGRYLALSGALVGTVLLIADLHTPQRWYNMLRIFRRTSPMSIGAWTLAGFGTSSGLTAAAQFLADRTHNPRFRRIARWCGIPAAVSGEVLVTYTGVLLVSTSTPLWATGERLLSALFGASAVSTACAALSLLEHRHHHPRSERRLARLALVAGATELALTTALDRRWQQAGVATPVQQEPLATAYRVGFQGLGILVPLAIHGVSVLTGRRSRRWSVAAALATLAGGYLLRTIIVRAGNTSAQRPRDYFSITQPQEQQGESYAINATTRPVTGSADASGD